MFRIGIDILIVVALTALTAVLFRPLHLSLHTRMTALRDDLIARGEAYLGLRIRYESMGPSIFGTLDIRKPRFYGSGAVPLMSLSRLRISYSVIKLFQGKARDSFHSVLLDKPVLILDEEQLAVLAALFERLRGEGENRPPLEYLDLIPRNLRIRIRGAECSFMYQDHRFLVMGLGLDSFFSPGRVQLRGKWNASAALNAFPGGQALGLAMTGQVTGEFDVTRRTGSLDLAIPSFSGDRFSLRTVTFNLDVNQEQLVLRKQPDRAPFDLALNYSLETGRVSGELQAWRFSPGDMLSFRGPWGNYNRFLRASTSGRAAFSAGGGEGLAYTLDLTGNLGNFQPFGPVSYTIICRGDTEQITFNLLDLGSARGSFHYTGDLGLQPLNPNGTIVITDFTLSGDGFLNAELAVSAQGKKISLFGDSLSLGPVQLTALDADIFQGGEGLSFVLSALRFSDTESYEDIRVSRLSVEGSLEYTPRHLAASLIMDAFSAEDILNMARPFGKFPVSMGIAAPVAKDIFLTTELFVTTDFEHILYNAPRFVVAYEGRRELLALASVSGTDRRFDLNEARFVWAQGGVEASGFVDFSYGQDISFALRGSYLDVPYFLEGFVLDGRSLSLQGSYGLTAAIGAAGTGGYSGYVKADAIPIPVGGQFARLRFYSSLYYNSSDFWSVELERLVLTDLATPASPRATVQISGSVDQDWAFFPNLFFDDGEGPLLGRAAFNWNRDRTRITTQMYLTNQERQESYRLEGSYQQDSLEMRFYGQGIQLNRMVSNSRNAVATGDARFVWNSMDSYSLTMNLTSLTAFDGERDISLSCQGSLNAEEFRIGDLKARWGTLQAELPLFKLNRREAYLQTEARLWGINAGRNLDISLAANAFFTALPSWFDLDRALNTFNGSLQVNRFQLDTLRYESPAVFVFSRSDSALSVSGGPNNMLRIRVTGEGAFYAGLSYPSPVRGTITGTINAETIDARTSNLYVDLASLWRFIPSERVLVCTGGFVNAALEIRGPLGDPEFFGTAQGHSVRLRVPQYVNAEIGPTPMTVTLEGNEMSFGPLTTPVGNGAGTVYGWFRFDRWIPNVFTLDIQSAPEQPIPFKVDIQGILAQGDVFGNLNLSMEDKLLRVTGALTGQDTEITLNTQELASGSNMAANQEAPVVADIVIRAGRKMEFLWPTADFPLLRAYADVGDAIRVRGDSVTGNFSVTGGVAVRSGELFYFQRNFYIRGGSLRFNESELQFEPRLTVRAETRDRNEEGPVTISLIVDNAPLTSFTARFESSPPLSQIEILSLLGQNMVSSGGGSNATLTAILEPTADILSQFYVFRSAERRVRNFLRLDILSFRTNFVQNLLLTPLRDPVDMSRVGNYFDNTAVFIGKYFGYDIFTQAMLSLRYDENKIDLGGLTPELDIGIELRNPLFDVRFNVVPSHPENLFVNDMSFTLSWRKSF